MSRPVVCSECDRSRTVMLTFESPVDGRDITMCGPCAIKVRAIENARRAEKPIGQPPRTSVRRGVRRSTP